MNKKLQVGDKAPLFSIHDQHGNIISLSQFRDKKVCLYFYPKDDTPGCTVQACSLRDEYTRLRKQGWEIIGVSADSVASHKKFSEKYDLPFSLLADEDKKIVNDYGVWGEKQMFGKNYMGIIRTTFLIDEKGYIAKIIDKPNTSAHAEEVVI